MARAKDEHGEWRKEKTKKKKEKKATVERVRNTSPKREAQTLTKQPAPLRDDSDTSNSLSSLDDDDVMLLGEREVPADRRDVGENLQQADNINDQQQRLFKPPGVDSSIMRQDSVVRQPTRCD